MPTDKVVFIDSWAFLALANGRDNDHQPSLQHHHARISIADYLFNASFNGSDQWGKVVLHSSPENLQVDIEIGMDQTISHPDDILPWN